MKQKELSHTTVGAINWYTYFEQFYHYLIKIEKGMLCDLYIYTQQKHIYMFIKNIDVHNIQELETTPMSPNNKMDIKLWCVHATDSHSS